jgi:hypothetical protein
MSRSAVACLLLPFALGHFAGRAAAQQFAPIYGIRHVAPPEIWSIDLATGQATFVSKNMKQTKVACARHPRTGQIWLFSNVTPNKISVWDPATDAETTVHAGPNVQFHRVGFDADAKLYGVPLNSNVLYTIDTTTGALTQLGGMSGVDTGGDGGDLAFPPGVIDHFTYFASSKLYDVDVATRKGTLINSAIGFKSTGAGYTADGRLWVTSDTSLYEGDPATGTMTLVGGFGMKQVLDLTEDLSPLYFGVDDTDPDPNDTITGTVQQGGANAPRLLAAVEIDGSPTFVDFGIFTFDGAGVFTASETIDPSLSGHSFTLTVYGITATGDLLQTNLQTITVQ